MNRIANKYEIQEKIGEGMFGSVFLGEKISGLGLGLGPRQEPKKKVAIKIEKEGSRTIRNESRMLEFLARHGIGKNIAQVFWYGMQENYSILVMTFIDGISLTKYISETSRTSKEKMEWFLAAIQILEKIHSVGVIHRDIKPAHFLCWRETWYLIDFGFSTFSLEASASASTSNSTLPAREYIIGSPNYISLAIHHGISPTARDDFVSLVYIFLEIWENERLPWSRTVVFSREETEKYPECHRYHIQNQYKKKYKEKWEKEHPEHLCVAFLQEIYRTNTTQSVYTRIINWIINNINNYA